MSLVVAFGHHGLAQFGLVARVQRLLQLMLTNSLASQEMIGVTSGFVRAGYIDTPAQVLLATIHELKPEHDSPVD